MRHRKAGSKLNRNSSHRNAMFRNMVTSLLKHDRIQTTDVRAKILRGWADHIITLAKRGDLHARRQAMAIVREKNVVHKLFEEAGTRFGAAAGGYTRIIKLGFRPGDAARMAIIELVEHSDTTGKKKTRKRSARKSTGKPTAPSQKAAATKETTATKAEPVADDDRAEPKTQAALPAEASAPSMEESEVDQPSDADTQKDASQSE